MVVIQKTLGETHCRYTDLEFKRSGEISHPGAEREVGKTHINLTCSACHNVMNSKKIIESMCLGRSGDTSYRISSLKLCDIVRHSEGERVIFSGTDGLWPELEFFSRW